MLTLDIMRQMWPYGDTKISSLIEAIAAAAPTVFPKYDLTSDLLVSHAMAQFSHECSAGTEVVENLNYSAQGLITGHQGSTPPTRTRLRGTRRRLPTRCTTAEWGTW